MVNRTKKNFLLTLGSMMLVLIISLVGLSGCNIKEAPSGSSANAGVITGKDAVNENTPSTKIPDSTMQSTPNATNTEKDKPAADSNDKTDGSTLADYIKLLGMNKKELTDTLGEKPDSADEGGLIFAKAGIRIWLDTKNGTADQVFTQSKNIDLNGVKIGDKIEKFENTFGKPVSDRNGDMHFKYKDIFLSVNYDTTTRDTYALYILAKDF